MIIGPINAILVTNDSDQNIFVLTAGGSSPLTLHEFFLTSAAIVAENLSLQLRRETTAGAGGGVTEATLADGNTTTPTATMVTLDLSPGTPGDILPCFEWEQLGPLHYQPTPKAMITVDAGNRIALHLGTALAATIVMSGYVIWEEHI